MQEYHVPVLADEVSQYLLPKSRWIVDCTLGGGGHAAALLRKSQILRQRRIRLRRTIPNSQTKSKLQIIAIDQDIEAINYAKERLKEYGERIIFVQDNFKNIKNIITKRVDGILFDLGVSSHQIDAPERGFSLRSDGPLDMRMDQNLKTTALDLIRSLSQKELTKIIREYGEEPLAAKIVARVQGSGSRIRTTEDFRRLIEDTLSFLPPKRKLDAVTRTFQALRIAVNNELGNLKTALNDAIDVLLPGGRIVVISYHSLEDRLVKEIFKRESVDCLCPPKLPECRCGHKKRLKILTRKPIVPSEKEIEANPRARSAKMRVAEKLDN